MCIRTYWGNSVGDALNVLRNWNEDEALYSVNLECEASCIQPKTVNWHSFTSPFRCSHPRCELITVSWGFFGYFNLKISWIFAHFFLSCWKGEGVFTGRFTILTSNVRLLCVVAKDTLSYMPSLEKEDNVIVLWVSL